MGDHRTRRTPDQQMAFDAGGGQRGISHRHENPFDAARQPDLHAHWEAGWSAADREADRLAEAL